MVTKNTPFQSPRSKGFTIVELAVVIVVMGILAAITIVSYRGMQDSAQGVATESNIRTYIEGLELYKARYHSYPVVNTWEERHTPVCIGAPPADAVTASCGSGEVKGSGCGIDPGTYDGSMKYNSKLSELMQPFIGAVPQGVLTKTYTTTASSDDCTIDMTVRGAIYQARQRIWFYQRSDGSSYVAGLVAPEGYVANAYLITYGATDGECTIKGSIVSAHDPGDPTRAISCYYYDGDPRYIEFRPA